MFVRKSILILIPLWLAASAPLDARGGVDRGITEFVPWSGSYWPISEGLLIGGPLTKYDHITGRGAARWEYERNSPGPQVPYWFGYCHAWCSAAVMDREPIRTRTVVASDVGPIALGIGDQKGMLTACHTQDIAQHYGIRYTGEPDEDPQDIYPDELWRVLRLYIKQQSVPIVMDIEAGTEVWNYPVYAYQVSYGPDESGSQYIGEMSLWMCDDTVPPDFVGVKVVKGTYYFTFQMQGGSLVMGSGRWVGPSVTNHPDFAWYPHVAVAENPEMQYAVVKELVDASGAGPSRVTPPVSDPAVNSPQYANTADPRVPGRAGLPPNALPGALAGTSAPTNGVGAGPGNNPPTSQPQATVLSPVELLSLVTNQTSSFTVDVTVDKYDGGKYQPGEPFLIRGTSAEAGFLYLFYLDGQGNLAVLFPRAGSDNRIPAQHPFQVPGSDGFRTWDVPGTHRVKAVVLRKPCQFSSLLPSAGGDGQERRGQRFHLPPSQATMFHDVLGRYQRHQPIRGEELGGVSPREILGDFGQDEVAFYVGPVTEPGE
jgi:hypothetical protein